MTRPLAPTAGAGHVVEAPAGGTPKTAREPYVGLRPFEASEGHLLCGRGDDVRFLCDKIFSAPLTLLYAQSGIGKSSLLRARVVPELEADEAVVVYFDEWLFGPEVRDATAPLKAALARRAGHSNAERTKGTLCELVRELSTRADSSVRPTVVLLLDQFEEFLLKAPGPDPLRKELAALLRAADLDVRVVLSLREEFLAALEPFKGEMLALFRSTYRLEPLSDADVRKAISTPAAEFGVSCETALLDTLIEQLRTEQGKREQGSSRPRSNWRAVALRLLKHLAEAVRSRRGAVQEVAVAAEELAARSRPGEIAAPVDLPFLQLVCRQLWFGRDERSPSLTLALYKKLGGIESILSKYVSDVMPKDRGAQEQTARLLEFLAPPSGLKMSYSAKDLAQYTQLLQPEIESELSRLQSHLILHMRQYRNTVRYELQHDALIHVLAPWRDKILARAEERRLASRFLAVLGVLVVIALGATFWGLYQGSRAQAEYERNTVEQFAGGGTVTGATFERVANYLLWHSPQKDQNERLRDLRELFEKHEQRIPRGYGTFEHETPPPQTAELTLRYSASLVLDEAAFAREWYFVARELAQQWGLPLPARLHLLRAQNLPAGQLALSAPGGYVSVECPAQADSFLVGAAAATRRVEARQFVQQTGIEWRPLPLKHGLDRKPEAWVVVPRWSLPVWRALGELALDGSGLPARVLASKFLERPELLLSADVTRALLERVRMAAPVTVDEALMARGERLDEDLAALVRRGVPLTDLASLLDALAGHGAEELTDAVAEAIARDRQQGGNASAGGVPGATSWPLEPRGAWDDVVRKNLALKGPGQRSGGPPAAPRYVGDLLPSEVRPEIRIEIGRQLETWIRSDGKLARLGEALQRSQRRFYDDNGVAVPVRVVPSTSDLTPLQVRIRVFEGDPSKPLEVPDEAEAFLIQEFEKRARASRARWVSAEAVSGALLRLHPALRAWLKERYSITDLKHLLRAVVTDVEAEFENTQPSSIRFPEWLFASLVFWNVVSERPQDFEGIARQLRDLQRARHNQSGRCRADGPVAAAVKALRAGDVDSAARTFRGEAQRHDVGEPFLRAYACSTEVALDLQPPSLLAPLNVNDVTTPALQAGGDVPAQRVPLATLFAWDDLLNVEQSERKGLVLRAKLRLYDQLAPNLAWQRSLAGGIVAEFKDPKWWPADPASLAFFGDILLDTDPFVHQKANAALAKVVIGATLERAQPTPKELASEFLRLIARCARSRRGPSCRNLALELLEDNSRWLPPKTQIDAVYELFSRHHELAWYGRSADLARAEALAGELAAWQVVKVDPLLGSCVTLTQAAARAMLADYSPGPQSTEATALVQRLEGLAGTACGGPAKIELGNLLLTMGKLEEARRPIDDALAVESNNSTLHALRFFLHLARRDADAMKSTLEALHQTTSDETTLFIGALAHALLGVGQEDTLPKLLDTAFEQSNLVAALALVNGSAERRTDLRSQLEASIQGSATTLRDERLARGDVSAWQELLTAYFLDPKLDWKSNFEALEDEQAFAGSTFSHLERERRGLLCQARLFDALKARLAGDRTAERAKLEAVLETNMRRYHEYRVAAYLLSLP